MIGVGDRLVYLAQSHMEAREMWPAGFGLRCEGEERRRRRRCYDDDDVVVIVGGFVVVLYFSPQHLNHNHPPSLQCLSIISRMLIAGAHPSRLFGAKSLPSLLRVIVMSVVGVRDPVTQQVT